MKRVLLATIVLGLTVTPAFAQSVPELPFESVPNPLKLPNDIYFGEIAGVAVNSRGHVFVFSRGNSTGPSYMATASQLLEFDANGTFVREIGKNLGSSQRSVQLRPVYMANKSSINSDLRGFRTPSVSGEELQTPGVRPTGDGGIARGLPVPRG